MREEFVKKYLLPILKSALFSVCITLVSVLLLALIVKLTTFSSVGVKIVNQFIKVISIFIGCLTFIKEGKGLIKGVFSGGVYFLLVTLIFALISNAFNGVSILDVLLCLFVGGMSGIIAVNLKEKVDF